MKHIAQDAELYTAPYAPRLPLNLQGDFSELVCVRVPSGKRRFFLKSRRGKVLKPLNPVDTLTVLENFFYDSASK
jgi:hypothetical protein